MYTIKQLMENSNLPGPRGNLELLYKFSKEADETIVNRCLSFISDDVANSPEEFAGMCGVLGYSVLHIDSNENVIAFLRKYASHESWRIREAVAMGIQEIAARDLKATMDNLKPLINGNFLERRAVVAGLCEPKVLADRSADVTIAEILDGITKKLDHGDKLSDSEGSLRKALGYGWSVFIVHAPKTGKAVFEKLLSLDGKHVRWIMKENLQKNRLLKMDKEWVVEMRRRLETASQSISS